jgi:hypothetical protein
VRTRHFDTGTQNHGSGRFQLMPRSKRHFMRSTLEITDARRENFLNYKENSPPNDYSRGRISRRAVQLILGAQL